MHNWYFIIAIRYGSNHLSLLHHTINYFEPRLPTFLKHDTWNINSIPDSIFCVTKTSMFIYTSFRKILSFLYKGIDKSKPQIHMWVKVSINSSSSIDANKKLRNLDFDYTLSQYTLKWDSKNVICFQKLCLFTFHFLRH